MVDFLALAVLAASIVLALGYFRWLERPASHYRAIFKTLPVLLLAGYAALSGAPALLLAALLLGAIGDAFLAYDGKPAFIRGLAAFLLAHLAYVGLFWPALEPEIIITEAWRYAAAWTLVIVFSMMLFVLWKPAGALAPPVAAYALAIIAMALSALAVGGVSLFAGAALFTVSDMALAIQTFLVGPKSPAAGKLRPLIWGSYYAAQLILTLAIAGLPLLAG
ncbi:lysoplasmalogenase [Rhizobiaceae bacterium LC148]|nr:hypothetical protein YH62_21640 [Rhizobium sp. LC145]TKT57095.1 lysoplasmalogenase [Rhizobiaceae bacterium LC148]